MARFPFLFCLSLVPGLLMRKGALLSLVLGIVLVPASAAAVMVENLYRAEIPVEDTGAAARDDAVREGLAKVLVRVTGSRSVLEHDEIQALLEDAAQLVDSYRYQERDDELLLQVQLNASGISRELAERDISVWGANRPGILVWLVVSDRTGREVIHREVRTPEFLEEPRQPIEEPRPAERTGWKASLYQESQERGVPLELPWFDETDQEKVGMSELWGLFREPIEAATSRYAPDRVAIVRVSERGGQWQARWEIGRPGEEAEDSGELTGEDEEKLVAALVDQWAEHYSRLFAVSPADMGDPQRLDLIVDGVDSMAAYAAVRRALQSMEPVRSADPGGVSRDQLRLRLQFSGDVAVLREYVALDHRFKPLTEVLGVQEPERFDPLPSAWRVEDVRTEDDSDEVRFAGLYPELRYKWRPDGEEDEEIEAIEEPVGDEESIELIDIDSDGEAIEF